MLTIKVKQTIKRFGMLKSGDHIVVAVSGGPDSVCLFSVLQTLAKDLGITLHIAHLDHMFRGRESAVEALFVERLAKKAGVPATIETIDVPAFCRERGLSSQEGARTVRYGFLQKVVKTTGASCIATGHTADDQAETLLMRLIRGAGVAGLSAIPPMRENIIRPLIETTRDDILEYLRQNTLEFAVDPSNAKPVYTRNRIRQDLVPMLKNFNPRIIETLATEAALLRDEDAATEACLSPVSSKVISTERENIVLMRDTFNALPMAFQRRLLRKAVDLAGGDPSRLSSVQIEEALSFMAATRTGRALQLPQGLFVEREYRKFIVGLHPKAGAFSHAITLPGETTIPELGMQVETRILEPSGTEPMTENYLWQAVFDYDKIRTSLVLRNRLQGDRFCPAGMGGRSKKLQDYFVDEKIPRRKREAIPLLVSGNDILWVVGFRTDNRFLLGKETRKALRITIRNSE